MTVAEYIFDFIYKKDCKTVFMVSGSSAMWLTDALKRNEGLKTVCCHHEQAAAMAADGYGRVNGAPGVCLVTIGPGATNAVTGVAQAYLDSSPMFVLSGQANSRLLKYEMETGIRQHGTQSLNLKPIVSSITKYFAVVMEPADIRYHMEKAYYEAVSTRKGPVWIDVPVNIQNMQTPGSMRGYEVSGGMPAPGEPEERIREVAEQLKKAERPLILAGNGVRNGNAVTELEEFCRKYVIPIVTSRGGIDVIDTCNELFIGRPGSYGDRASHFAISQCDFLLILGSRLSVSTIGYYPQRFAEKAYKVMVDVDEKELAKEDVPIENKLNMDVRLFLQQLMDVMEKDNCNSFHKAWMHHCTSMREKYPNVLPEYETEVPLNEYYFSKKLAENTPSQSNIVVDTGSVCNIVSQSWIVKPGQRYLISGGLSCMGFWATALGVCQEGRQVIAITGDGSAQMNIQEFATLQYNRLPVKLFIYNNNGYMLIRHNQHNYMNDRFLGVGPDSGLKTPDFVKVARAYGLPTMRIIKEDDIDSKIKEALDYDGPIVCEVLVQEFAPIVPRIASRVMPDGSLKAAEFDDLYPFLEE